MPSHVYVGVSNRTGGVVSGLYRRPEESDRWDLCGLPDGTHVHAIAVHPDDPAVVLVATSAGLLRSNDRGKTWTCLVEAEPPEQMWSVQFHPNDPRIILTGTAPLGLHRSDDGGRTWRRMPRPAIAERMVGAFPSRIMRMGIAPSRPDVIWAGMEVNGAMRSDDGGESWTDLSDELVALSHQPHLESAILTKDKSEGMLDVHAICVSPSMPETPFLALRMGLFRGEDRGAAWTDLKIGQHAAHLRYGRDIVVAPWDPGTLFACVADSSRGDAGRLYRSDDIGTTWRQIDHDVTVSSTMMGVGLNPADPSRIHCVARRGQTFSTSDGGQTWREVSLPAEAGTAVAIACG
ncbi:MAG: WD40/YVTN/BNR-like repeat-containing protein [Acetobacteraceae bacterium]